jgi:acetoin utilization protein AcuB
MARDPITISSEAFLSDACRLMKDNDIRRLPVIDGGKLVGILTWSDMREALPFGADSSAIFEQNHPVAKMLVSQIMTPDPITVTPVTTIDQAAQIMLQHKISGMPVVLGDKMIGIITDSDILRILVAETAGWSARV